VGRAFFYGACTGSAQVGVELVSFSIHSSNCVGCIAYVLHAIKYIPETDMLFYVETHKVSTCIRGWEGSRLTLVQACEHKQCHEQVHSARSSCTAPERVQKR